MIFYISKSITPQVHFFDKIKLTTQKFNRNWSNLSPNNFHFVKYVSNKNRNFTISITHLPRQALNNSENKSKT